MLQPAKRNLVRWLARRLPPCQEITPLVSAAMDRRLTVRERVRVRLHLWVCEACRRFERQLGFLHEAHQAHGFSCAEGHEEDRAAAGPGLSSEARERLRQRLSAN